MAYSYGSVGTVAIKNLTLGGDTISPGAPSGVTTGDLLLLFVASRQTPSVITATGYERLDTLGRVTLFGRIATGSGDTPTVSITVPSNGYCHAQYARFAGSYATIGSGGADILEQAAAETSAAAVDIATSALTTPGEGGCLIVYAGFKLNDIGTYSSLPNGSTLIAENNDSTGSLQSIWSYTIQTTAAAVGASSFDYASADTNTYYSTVLALLPGGTLVKYLKALVHSSAAGLSVAGTVHNNPDGSGITGTKIGEFTGISFLGANSLDGGKAKLLVNVSSFGGSALTTANTPIVYLRTSSFDTSMFPATVIEV